MLRPVLGSGHPPINPPKNACHNCRRRRLRCDRSLPGCEKCHGRAEVCLGYGVLLRWTDAVTARETRPGPDRSTRHDERRAVDTSLYSVHLPIDPILQDLGPGNRLYVSHFDRSVCQDLVSHDRADRANPFRLALALLHDFPYLREIVLATSAVHMASLHRCRGAPHHRQVVDALTAKGRAYRLLRQALDHLDTASKPIAMVAVLFFINFDLIDSGRGGWKTHIEAAGNLLTSIQSLGRGLPPEFARLADIVVADCITYHILGSVFARPEDNATSAFRSVDTESALERTAAFSYGCAPPFVLGVLARTSRLLPDGVSEAVALVGELLAFDARAWVYNIRGLSALDDLDIRVSMANTHRVAALLCIILAVPDASAQCQVTAGELLVELLGHIESVPLNHALAKGLVWSTFVAGAQAEDSSTRQSCLARMQAVKFATPFVCPWGYVESAINMLQRIWKNTDRKTRNGEGSVNWLLEMRSATDHCLIV